MTTLLRVSGSVRVIRLLIPGPAGVSGPNAVSDSTTVGSVSAPAFGAFEAWPADVMLIQETAEGGNPDRIRRATWTAQAVVEASAAGTRTLVYDSEVKYLFTQAKGAKTASGTATVSVRIDGTEVQSITVTTTPTDINLASAPWPGVPVQIGETLSVVVSGTFTGLIFNLFGWRV